MRFPKSLERAAGAIALAGALFFGGLKKADAEAYLYGQANYGLELGLSSVGEIQSIPEYMRYVPIHPDDTYAREEDNGIIEYTERELPQFHPVLNAEAGIGLQGGLFDFHAGPKLELILVSSLDSAFKERNYTNYPGTDIRGYGAALTYYSAFVGNPSPFVTLGADARLSLKLFEKESGSSYTKVEGFLEYSGSFSPTRFILKNGWDRFDEHEIDKTYDFELADIINHALKFGVSYTPMSFKNNKGFSFSVSWFGEVYYPQIIKKTSFADEIGFNTSPCFMFGVEMDTRIRTKK
ncbi:MAG: hypothetical protein PHH00_03580 [Candidatus Nanoarchaeia archaeon]|nr:hypothetical protein [Candidatus Nanoarchaeia archaeon]